MASVSTGRRRRGSFLIGILLVALGVLLLLTTTGVVSFGVWIELVDYWPILLVLIGVDLILVRQTLLIRAGVVVLTLAVVFAAASLSMPEYDPAEPLRVNYVEPLGTTETLRLSMEFLGGSVELTSAPPGTSSLAGLLEADFQSHPARVIREQSGSDIELYSSGPFLRRFSDDGYTRRESTVSFPVGLADWNLIVSPDVEVEIDIASGSSDLNLDLRGLNVRRLAIEGGASNIKIHLPTSAGQTHIDIAVGSADIELFVPHDVVARIDVDSPMGSVWIDPGRFVYTEDVYQSPHYFEAHNRVSIDIEALWADVITVPR